MRTISEINVYESRIPENEYKDAINKLLYEISYRKEEYLKLCMEKDKNNLTHLKPEEYKEVLNLFTIYPNDYEKNLIIRRFTVNEEYIDYVFISNLKPEYTISYEDFFLQHLNNINKKIDNKEMHSSVDKMGSDLNLSALEKLNCELNEENFITKICKNIMNHIMVNSKGIRPFEFLDNILKKNDFDNDGYFTIGEVNNFLNETNIFLADSDLKFFFEYFPLFRGRIDIEQLTDIIKTNSQKKLEETAKTQYHETENKKVIKIEEQKEDKYYDDILRSNYIVNVVKECLLIFGKTFLLKYFSKYLEFHNNEFFIDNMHLEAGLNSLGYKHPTPVDSNNFTIVCIFKGVGTTKTNSHCTINLEKLFQFISDYFKLANQVKKCNPDEIINRIGVGLVQRMNDSYLFSVTNHLNEKDIFDNRINEFEFRRKFIKSFGFIDHSFMDKQVHNLCADDDEDNDFNNTQSLNRMGIFSLKYIQSKKFLDLAYNISFMNMIKNYASLGLIFDDEDIEQLNRIYIKMQRIIFPEDENDNYYNFDFNSLGNKISNQLLKPNIRESDKFSSSKSISSGKSVYVLADFSKKALKINDITPKEEYERQLNNNIIKKKEAKKNLDLVKIIPKLHNICIKYLIHKYGLTDIKYDFIHDIGICRIFKDELIKIGVNMNKKFHWVFLIRNLEHLVTEDVKEFMTQLAMDIKDTDGNLMIPFYFYRLEEILLQYTKLEEQKFKKEKLIRKY